ncbi:MAG: hypothetical protein HZA93_29610 [Verrucomicrobia bacterium]|nr:hypothetical protein [Verrucomicrobiota bacterium]
MVLLGKVSNGTVILPPNSRLAEGTEVEVRPRPSLDSIALSGAVADLTDELVSLAAQTRGLPADLAAQHDHYLHGQPKR